MQPEFTLEPPESNPPPTDPSLAALECTLGSASARLVSGDTRVDPCATRMHSGVTRMDLGATRVGSGVARVAFGTTRVDNAREVGELGGNHTL